MRLVPRLAYRNRLRKAVLVLLITVISTAGAVLPGRTRFLQTLNEPIYDRAYKIRAPDRGRTSPIVIVAANDGSLAAMAHGDPAYGWPWPRQFWGFSIEYVQKCGARAVVVDILFSEPSIYKHDFTDDETFAEKIDQSGIPVVLGSDVSAQGSFGAFAPPVKRPANFGAVNLEGGSTIRDYLGTANGKPSVALRLMQVIGAAPPTWADKTFRLQYYGHHELPTGKTTFPYVPAADVFQAAIPLTDGTTKPLRDPSIFKDKIVIFGTTAAATLDTKASPLDGTVPGVEIQATAIENLLRHQRVQVLRNSTIAFITALAAAAAAAGATAPRRTWLKLLLPALAAAALVLTMAGLFRRQDIIWLPPVVPLIGIGLSMVLALSWSYFAEDRESRFFLRALGQYVSPQVAAELKSNPDKLAISTEKREVTILFSDIVGFTTISETLDERVGPLLNFYLDEMSEPVLKEDGTLDKYIGDAVMCFWNAPIAQKDHAIRACRAALAMQHRLREIQPQLAELGAPGLHARIGINTGVCAFGNMGSRSKFSYSIIGDACNFASRLEGANKMYRTGILIGQETWNLVWDHFITRKVDVIRAMGKQHPIAIYELIGHGLPEPAIADLINQYESAYRHYCRSEWTQAEQILMDILKRFPQDGPSLELLSRIADFRHGPTPEFWDGVYVAKEK